VVLLSITLMVGAVTLVVASFLFISTAISTLTESSRAVWPFPGTMSAVILLEVLCLRLMLFLPRSRMG
jgi:TRAP-type C4-dicarboxylate transport system permease large subunit